MELKKGKKIYLLLQHSLTRKLDFLFKLSRTKYYLLESNK